MSNALAKYRGMSERQLALQAQHRHSQSIMRRKALEAQLDTLESEMDVVWTTLTPEDLKALEYPHE